MKHLTECEELVMSVIWSSDSIMNLPQIVENVNKRYGKEWAMQTVSTFLTRLRRKNVIDAERVGRTFYYHVIMPKEEYTTQVAKRVCDLWFGGNVEKMAEAARK